jgi:hypothetical protein
MIRHVAEPDHTADELLGSGRNHDIHVSAYALAW